MGIPWGLIFWLVVGSAVLLGGHLFFDRTFIAPAEKRGAVNQKVVDQKYMDVTGKERDDWKQVAADRTKDAETITGKLSEIGVQLIAIQADAAAKQAASAAIIAAQQKSLPAFKADNDRLLKLATDAAKDRGTTDAQLNTVNGLLCDALSDRLLDHTNPGNGVNVNPNC